MVGPAFECPLEVGADALARVVSRMVGITQDPSANPTSQLSAVRLVIGLERQIFHAAKEELLTRRAIDPTATMRQFEPVISIAIIKQLITFLTGMIHQPEVSETHAVRAGNLLLSLQKLALDESKWKRIQSTPKPPNPTRSQSGASRKASRSQPNVERPAPASCLSNVATGISFDATGDAQVAGQLTAPMSPSRAPPVEIERINFELDRDFDTW